MQDRLDEEPLYSLSSVKQQTEGACLCQHLRTSRAADSFLTPPSPNREDIHGSIIAANNS